MIQLGGYFFSAPQKFISHEIGEAIEKKRFRNNSKKE